MKHTDLKNAALRRAGVRAQYEALEPEFELLREIGKLRGIGEGNWGQTTIKRQSHAMRLVGSLLTSPLVG